LDQKVPVATCYVCSFGQGHLLSRARRSVVARSRSCTAPH
jgi:hypothetical protein